MANDPSTDAGYVRLLITDTDDEDPVFDESEIAAFISRESSLKRAAASALEVMARSEVLMSKKIRTQDLSTDGPAVSAELRALAKQLRAEAANDEGGEATPAFEVAAFSPYGPCVPELTEHPLWWH